VLDRLDPLLEAEAQSKPAHCVGGDVGADPARLLDGGADLLARVDTVVEPGPFARDAAGGEDLEEVGAVVEVLAGAPADLVGTVEVGAGAAVAVEGGDAAPADQQARPGDETAFDGAAERGVDEVLLRHHPQRRRAGAQVPAEVAGASEYLLLGRPAELAG